MHVLHSYFRPVRALVASLALVVMLSVASPSRASAQGVAMTDNAFLRMSAILFMTAGTAGFFGTWIGYPFFVEDQHFRPCTGECTSEFGLAWAPIGGPWAVLSSSEMVPGGASVGFGIAQIGSLALVALGVVMWGVSENPDTGQPEFIGLTPMVLPGGGGVLANLSLP